MEFDDENLIIINNIIVNDVVVVAVVVYWVDDVYGLVGCCC